MLNKSIERLNKDEDTAKEYFLKSRQTILERHEKNIQELFSKLEAIPNWLKNIEERIVDLEKGIKILKAWCRGNEIRINDLSERISKVEGFKQHIETLQKAVLQLQKKERDMWR